MGCGESKDLQRISVSDAQKKLESSLEGLEVVRLSSASLSGQGSAASAASAPNMPQDKVLQPQESKASLGDLPTTLDSIPTNDLGVSDAIIKYTRGK